jgi:hypothetical protein
MFAARNSFMAGKVIEKDASFSSVVALLHGDGANASTTITDSSSSAASWTAYGNAQLSTSTKKFGTASIAFDGNGDYIKPTSGSTNLVFGTGDFTIELWFNLTSYSGTTPFLFDWRPPGQTPYSPAITIGYESTNKLTYYQGGGSVIFGSTTISTGTWYHAAVSRASGTTRLFLNGVQEGSNFSDSYNYAQNQPTFGALGYDPTLTAYAVNGYLDDIRVTKGVARYTTTFTPPTAAFPDA